MVTMVSGPDALLELAGGAEGEDATVVHHGNPVAELVGFFHVVVVSRMVWPRR